MPRQPGSRQAALILAGGSARRMGGGDKGLLRWQGEPFVSHLQRLFAVVGPVAVVTQPYQTAYQRSLARPGTDFVHDCCADQGPLAGLSAGLTWAAARGCAGAFVAPCDSPRLGPVWLQRLRNAVEGDPGRVHVCAVAGRLQPLHGWFPAGLAPELAQALDAGARRAGQWVEAQAPLVLDCSDLADQFVNVNRPEDLDRLDG